MTAGSLPRLHCSCVPTSIGDTETLRDGPPLVGERGGDEAGDWASAVERGRDRKRDVGLAAADGVGKNGPAEALQRRKGSPKAADLFR